MTTMEVSTSHEFERMNTVFVTPDDPLAYHRQEEWHGFGGNLEQTLSICPSLLHQDSVGESDQSLRYEELSPSELCHDLNQEASVLVEHLNNRVLRPLQHPESFQEHQQTPLSHTNTEQSSATYLGASIKTLCIPIEVNNSALQPITDSEPRKRRRGRPRLHPRIADIPVAREYHLEKNRVAAEKSRQRKKEHTDRLMKDVSVLSSKNKTLKADETALREEVLDLKNEILRHAGCGSWAIERYIAQSAGGQFGMKVPSISTRPRKDSTQSQNLVVYANSTEEIFSEDATESLPCQLSSNSSNEVDDYDSFWLISGHENLEEEYISKKRDVPLFD
jgi:hypothetical protein